MQMRVSRETQGHQSTLRCSSDVPRSAGPQGTFEVHEIIEWLGWKGPENHPVPTSAKGWLPSTGAGCAEPHPAGRGHLQGWEALSRYLLARCVTQ